MGNAPSSPAPPRKACAEPTNPYRVVDMDRRIHVEREKRTFLRHRLLTELQQRPLTAQDAFEMKRAIHASVMTKGVPVEIQDVCTMLDKAVGRTLMKDETMVIARFLDDNRPVRLAPMDSFDTTVTDPSNPCQCRTAGCVECAASSFRLPQRLPIVEVLQRKQNMRAY